MKFRSYALLALATSMGLVACSKDITADGSGSPQAIITSRSLTTQTAGTKFSVTAYAIDANVQRMEGKLDATSASSNVVIDSVVYVKELLQTNIYINAATKTPTTGGVITVKGHGLSKDVTVVVS